ncbi:unnamed protein product [Ilex paraguariensis]|uniref:Photosystem II D1 processing protein PSB27-H2, chloroplastic n=1 Tax=Ilex paraguariensis TaxID=185542 RepID=A0ABC8UZ81_9AQUA
MAVFLALKIQTPLIFNSTGKEVKASSTCNLQSRCHAVLPSQKPSRRRQVLVSGALVAILTLNNGSTPLPACAGDESTSQEDQDQGLIGSIKTLFDPTEKTKSGKVLPKAYLKSARETDADAAKESIRDYLSGWRGQKTVVNEESYVVIEKAIRSLASFYSKAGPSAPLPEEVKSEILKDLNSVEEFLRFDGSVLHTPRYTRRKMRFAPLGARCSRGTTPESCKSLKSIRPKFTCSYASE